MINLFNKLPVIVLLIISSIGVISGDFFAKYWSIKQKAIFFVLAVLGYLVSSFFYIPTLLREGLVITSIIWSLLSIIGFLFIGLIIFHEKLTVIQYVGVFIGILALIILSLE